MGTWIGWFPWGAQDEPVNLRPRERDDMVAAANQILEVADAFLAAVDAKLTDA